MTALFQCLSLQHSTEATIKASLLIITFWFKEGTDARIRNAIQNHQKRSPLKGWLLAIPQLIARMGAKDEELRGTLLMFLGNLASAYPDALIWGLLTAAQTPRSINQTAAKEIMLQMSASGHTEMVQQVSLLTIVET